MSLRSFLRLARFQTAPLTALAPVMGASLCAGFSWQRDLLLFGAGLGCHLFGFVHNEILDVEVDRLAPDLARKPLVEGSIDRGSAWRGALVAAALGVGLMAALAPLAGVVTAAAVAAAYGYNLGSKRVPFLDWAIAASMGLLVLAGALAAAGAGGVQPLAGIVALLLALQLLVQNTLAHLKDLRQDRAAGGVNAALLLGVEGPSSANGAAIRTGAAFQSYLILLRGLHLLLVALGVWLLPPSLRLAAAAVAGVTQAAALRPFWRLIRNPPEERGEFLGLFFRHEMPTMLAVTVLLVAELGWGALLPYVLLPLLWAVATLRWLHGGEMPAL
jgi:4-hydroxybenzoate polyprenyltransferase